MDAIDLAVPRSRSTLGAGLVSATLAFALGFPAVVSAQGKLPPPSRTVFKCTVEGKVVYSDDPCPGAQKVDVEPTRGLDRSSGRQRTGADVRRERNREALAEAIRPLTAMDSKQFETAVRRQELSPQARQECTSLDRSIQALEEREQSLPVAERNPVQGSLYEKRGRYRKLGC